MRVLEVTGEPILHGGQEKFIENIIENIDHNDLVIDVLTPYYCENEAFTESTCSSPSNNAIISEIGILSCL